MERKNNESGERQRACKLFVIILMVVFIMVLDNAEIAAAQTAGQCKEQRRILVNACKPVIIRRPPSAYCCQRLRVTNVNCVCPIITPQLAALIDVNYAIRVIQSCGRQVPRHFKCGSITTP